VDPIVIGRFGGRAGCPLGHAFELWPRHRVELPAFRAEVLRIGKSRTREFALAKPAVKASEIAAREHRPEDAVAGDVAAPRSETAAGHFGVLPWHFIIFAELRLGIVANDAARETEHRSPHGAVR